MKQKLMLTLLTLLLYSVNSQADGYYPIYGKVIGKSDYDRYLIIRPYEGDLTYKVVFKPQDYQKYRVLKFTEGNFLASSIFIKKKGSFRYTSLLGPKKKK